MKVRTRGTLLVVSAVLVLLLGACSSGGSKSATTTEPPPTPLLETIGHHQDLTSFATAVTLAGLTSTLDGTGPYTVFVPINSGLVLADGTLGDPTTPAAKAKLTALLRYHIVPGALHASDLQPGALTTIDGQTFTVAVDGNDITLTDAQGRKAKVVEKDIDASNGVIQVIDSTLLPPKS